MNEVKNISIKNLKMILIGYNYDTIYRIHIKSQKKFIKIKNFGIFEDNKTKTIIKLCN